MRNRNLYFVLLAILLVAALVRLVPIGDESVEGDELFSRRVALEPLPSAVEIVRQDLVHPPLYYLLLKATVQVWGASALGIRGLSILSSLALVVLLPFLGRQLPGGDWCGLIASASVAVSQTYVFYAQQARSYALYSLLVVLVLFWAAWMFREKSNRLAGLLLGVLCLTSLVYCHYVGAIYVFVLVLSSLFCPLERKTKLTVFAAATCAAGLFFAWLICELPVYRARQGVGKNLGWQEAPSIKELLYVWANSIGTFQHSIISMAVIVAILLTGLWLYSNRFTFNPLLTVITTMAFVPPILLFLLSRPPLNVPLFGTRHLLPSMICLALLLGYLLEQIFQRQQVLALTGIAVLIVLGIASTFQSLRRGPMRFPYERIADNLKRGGAPAYAAWFYGEGETVNFYCRPACVEPTPSRIDALPPRFMFLYRPSAQTEASAFSTLRQDYRAVNETYYSNGENAAWGIDVVEMERIPR